MVKLSSEYWNKFIDKDTDGNDKGNGIEFENLIKQLLFAMYGKHWERTGGSHDNNRDFWIHLSEQSIWAECKNYKNTIAMNILAPTLVMAQIYEVNEILFFSRSDINRFAKDKIVAFGEKANKIIRFFDGTTLETLICTYALKLPKEYSPLKYMSNCDEEEEYSFVNVYFFRNIVSSVHNTSEVFLNYKFTENIYYNETFALTFCLINNLEDNQVEVTIEFMDEGSERYSFQYFYPTISPEKKTWYHTYLKKGEGRSVSLNMRQIVYKPNIMLPRFHVTFLGLQSGRCCEWFSENIIVKSCWVGATRLIGDNYLKILNEVDDRLINNPCLSGMIITGSSGTGKTRIITESQNLFLKNGYRIISFSGQENFSSHYFLKELIAFLYEIPSDEILDILEEKLFISKPENVIRNHTDAEKAICLLKKIIRSTTEEKLQDILNRYADILYEKLAKEKNVLIIDNIQFAGKAFQNFIESYVYYSVNQQSVNRSILVTVFNTDYMTPRSSELLYNLLHANIKHCIPITLSGFKEIEQGRLFLQELTRTRDDENIEYFSEIINKVSLKPYNLFQAAKYLEESEIIKISPDKKAYIISDLKKYEVLSDISYGISSVLEKRVSFICKHIKYNRLMYIFSIIYIFDFLDNRLQKIFQIDKEELDLLCEKNFLRAQISGIYIFDHDIIRNFFLTNCQHHIIDCLDYVKEKNIQCKIRIYPIAYLLYEIALAKNKEVIIDTGMKILHIALPERIASVFCNYLLDAFIELLENNVYQGIYIKYIHQICTLIRQYDGSQKAWKRSKELYDTIQAYYPQALSDDIKYYRPFIHFCCDIAVQTHMYEEEINFLKCVLEECKKVSPTTNENQDELNVLQAIMYNRWYISYNTQSYKNEIAMKRQHLMKKSRMYADKINNPQKRGLIEYLNDSDEGYNYYGYQTDKEKLFSIWNKCIIDIPTLVPEKTLNYYRKTVQYGLIEGNLKVVKEEIRKAMDYLENGEYSHEPIIFKTFFLMAEVMTNIQHNPGPTYYFNVDIIDNILKMQQLLDNHKIGDILLLKGVNAYYGGNIDDVYYSFKEAYKHYAARETSRYWIKKHLLEENIQYTFTKLGIYILGYDVSFLPAEYRQPIIIFDDDKFIASGIQRTGDLHLNLPLI